MAIIRVAKEQVEAARRARDKALEEDADFREFEESQDREFKQALAQREQRSGEEAK